MIRRILILLAALALCLSGLSVFADDVFEAGELHVCRVSMEETKPFRFAGTKIPPPSLSWVSGNITGCCSGRSWALPGKAAWRP